MKPNKTTRSSNLTLNLENNDSCKKAALGIMRIKMFIWRWNYLKEVKF